MEVGVFFRQLLNDDTACASYVLGCLTHPQLAVVEPHVDLVDDYLAVAEAQGAPIVATFETHLQADHVSGMAELVRRTGATAYMPAGAGVESHVRLSYLGIVHPQFHLIVDKDGKTNQPEPKHPSTSKTPLTDTLLDLKAGEVVLSDGVALLLISLWGFRRGERWVWWTLLSTGLTGLGCGIYAHVAVGYLEFGHLLPLALSAVVFIAALSLTAPFLLTRSPSSL